MAKVFVGNISPIGQHTLQRYLDVYAPDAVLEPLKPVGIKGKMKNHAARAEVLLVILDESLYQTCVGFADDVLAMSKVHKYTTDDSLTEFLIERFGKLDDTGSLPPDQLMAMGSMGGVYSYEEDFSNIRITNNQDELKELQDKLAQSELQIRNLMNQLKDKSAGSEEDLLSFVNRIKTLEGQLKEKEAELEQAKGDLSSTTAVSEEVENLKSRLKEVGEQRAETEHKRLELQTQLEQLQTSLNAVESEKSKLESDLEAKAKEIELLNSQLTSAVGSSSHELEVANAELQVLRDQIKQGDASAEELVTIKAELEQQKLEYKNLKIDFDTQVQSYDKLHAEFEATEGVLDKKTEELEAANGKIEELSAKILELEKEIASKVSEAREVSDDYDHEKDGLNKQIEALTEKCNSLNEDIASMNTELEALREKESQLTLLNVDLTTKTETIQTLNNELQDMRVTLQEKEDALRTVEQKLILSQDEVETSNRIADDVLEAKRSLEAQVASSTSRIRELTEKVTSLTQQLDKRNDEYRALSTEKLTADADVMKLKGEIEVLQMSVISSKTDAQLLTEAKNALFEEQRKSARLSTELELVKKSGGVSGASADVVEGLTTQINSLKSELEIARSSPQVDTTEIENLRSELQASRDKYLSVEMQLTEKDEVIQELEGGIFARLANIATLRSPVSESLGQLTGGYDRFCCVISGHGESSDTVCQNLAASCASEPNRRFLVLDITTDSSLDLSLGAVQVPKARDWLVGGNSYKNFIAKTKYQNVLVMSTALAPMNDLYLLNVDWEKQLGELRGLADCCILYLGCLNNPVVKVLFNTFVPVMKTYIMMKSRPVSIRSAILTLSTLGESAVHPNVNAVCLDYVGNDNVVQNFCTRLQSKYRTTLLQKGQILHF